PTSTSLMASLFIALFAFLLGSLPARNADVWMHLAAGRHLAQGPEWFDTVPHLPETRPGATWLYDLSIYALYAMVGGPGLVLCKALLVVALALVLLRLAEAGAPGRIPTLCVLLALLAMSTRLLLQPSTVSYLLLTVAVWLVGRDAGARPEARPHNNERSSLLRAVGRLW